MPTKISRRTFVKASSTIALSTVAFGAQKPIKTGIKEKPNLVVLWTDEQRADTMAAYDNFKIQTPNLNRLAQKSVVFRNAYITQPVCSPSRSTVMTGLWPHTSGVTCNNKPLDKNIYCLPELLSDSDYRTAYMGKWHLGDEIFAQHGFQEWVSIEDHYCNYFSDGRDKSKRSDYYHFLIDNGYTPDASGSNVFTRNFAITLPLEHCKPKFLETKACDFIRRNQEEPFILYVNYLEPHGPIGGPFDSKHDPEIVELSSNFSDPLEENEPLRYRLAREHYRDKYGKHEESSSGFKSFTAKYWGMITQVDLSVGGILNTLEELGLADDTIVVYTSDHGDMMGSHNLVEKCVMYEESVRVPWLMRAPMITKKGLTVNENVSHIDLVPTLMELMGKKPDDRLQGNSLVNFLKGGKLPEDYVFIEWNPGQGAIWRKNTFNYTIATKEEVNRIGQEHTRAVISPDGWKLCLSDIDKCQLFNLKTDPGETTNLFDSGKHYNVIAKLTKKIQEWQKETSDLVQLKKN